MEVEENINDDFGMSDFAMYDLGEFYTMLQGCRNKFGMTESKLKDRNDNSYNISALP